MRYVTFNRQARLTKNRLIKILEHSQTLSELPALNETQRHRALALYEEATLKNNEFSKTVSSLFSAQDSGSDYDEGSVDSISGDISDLFIDIQTVLKPLLPVKDNVNDSINSISASAKTNSNVRLPKLQLKSFNGDVLQWISYYNLFNTTVHNCTSLTDVEKFQFLLSTLQSEPLNLIKSLPLTSENYTIAYDTIVNRYHNPRILKSLHVNYLIDMPQCLDVSAKTLRNFICRYNEHSAALSSLGYDMASDNPFLITLLLRKFDVSLRTRFESSRRNTKELPTPKEFIEFLENECSYAENATLAQNVKHTQKLGERHYMRQNREPTPKPVTFFTTQQSTQTNAITCVYCKNTGHYIYRCNGFNKLSVQGRSNFIQDNKYCFNCLKPHNIKQCTCKTGCRICSQRHHTLLHKERRNIPPHSNTVSLNDTKNKECPQQSAPSTTPETTTADTLVCQTLQPTINYKALNKHPFLGKTQSYITLLGTALVKLSSMNGNSVIVRALIDSGSNTTIINTHVADLLHVKRSVAPHLTHLNGISAVPVKTKGFAKVNIYNTNDQQISKNHTVLILNKITANMPSAQISNDVINKISNFKLADPNFDRPGPVQMLIGADIFMDIITGSKYSLGHNMPYALDTVLGIVLMGKTPTMNACISDIPSSSFTTLLATYDDPLHQLMLKFWETESSPCITILNPEEIQCENHYRETHLRNSENGKYIVSLPFKGNPSELGDSSQIAKRRFFSLEKKLTAQPEFRRLYCDFMQDYLDSGHMKLYDTQLLDADTYFIPHHGVFKHNSSTTKLRVVFDASCKTTTNISLNDLLHVGPKLQNDIASIIVNFRRHSFVFTTDVKQMFRSIEVHDNDKRYQLIYWREDPSLPLSIYQLQTVTYGMSSSPFLANRTILQLIEDEGKNHKLASEALRSQIYVDDIALGADSLEDALKLQNDVITLLAKGGFCLRKWTANHKQLLIGIPEDHHEKPVYFRSQEQPLVSVLGLQWLPNSDCFSYQIEIKVPTTITKRSVLSAVAQLYDPCGFLSPVVFLAKTFIQHLWVRGYDWDAPLPTETVNKWQRFLQDLPKLEQILIGRSLSISNATDVHLHGFSDASEKGYAASVYVRTTNDKGEVNVKLIIAKTRVAPLKHMSLPRLELCGAYLLASLITFCVNQLNEKCHIDSVHAWCDSTVVLSWIKTPSYRLKVFIANRVSEIQTQVPPKCWKHIPSSQNPSDCASRGLYPTELLNNKSWFQGPEWLSQDPDLWPESKFNIKEEELPELRPITLIALGTVNNSEWDLLARFSSWTKLSRVLAYVLRFIIRCRNKHRNNDKLNLTELKIAQKTIIRLVQQSAFSGDIYNIKHNKSCSQRLQRLSPFIDEDNLLRVGGRIKHSLVPYDMKHPLILPKVHHITNIIIDYFHLKYLHAGPALLQSILSNYYWILSARTVIRSRIFKCMTCFRTKPKQLYPKMGDLPESRVNPAPAFQKTGIDYAGPFDVKIHTLRFAKVVKAYLCIFVCFTTKAVHIEVANDLSTNTFLAALTRFVSRRGLPFDIYLENLDNATNFVGAANLLKKTVKELLSNQDTRTQIDSFSHNNSVKFHFIPPTASHMGGLWERTVRSIKTHLYKTVNQHVLSLEEFQTLTTRIEAILNSRPLAPLSSDPSEIDVLTPGHFLIGRPLIALPEPRLEETPLTSVKRYQLVQAMTQHIWNRWKREILHHLQQRAKWTKDSNNLRKGDLVLIHETNTPPQTWSLGRVTSTSPGDDGIVRVVHLRTSKGSLTRPVVKVSPLPQC